jgi:hypothetical protein
MLARTGGFIGYDPEDTRVTASGVWSLEEAIRRQNDKNWGNYTAELVLDTSTVWTPARYSLNTSSNISSAYGVNRFFTTADATSHDIYIGFELRGTNAAYYKDMTIAGVEIKFGSTTETYRGSSWSGWSTTTAGVTAATSPTGLTYSTLAIGTTGERWNIDSAGTASSHTGMASGIGATPDFDSDLIGQSSSQYYLYVETSSPTANGDTLWLKKTITPAIGDDITIKIANYYNTSSTGAYSTVVEDCMQILVT